MKPWSRTLFIAWLAASSGTAPLFGAENLSQGDIDFFERKVRPLLSEHCLECHSLEKGKTKGGLSMDSRESLLKGGDSGPALISGHPEKSLLNRAARHLEAELQMPPKKPRISGEELGVLDAWVQRGAPDPRTPQKSPAGEYANALDQARDHWAFRPVRYPHTMLKDVADTEAVDTLLTRARESQGIASAAEADPRTLVRRLSYDLTGLPPSIEDVEAYAANPSRGSFRELAQKYIHSKRFGEKWGRHWLDIARYADTRGVPVPITSDPRFLYSYAYRDYVITSFNSDIPLNQFILEQLAADLLNPIDVEKQTALGFLTLGRTFLNNPHDIIDDRIDVVTRGLMGITVTCARCHDHKFDPIPTADYYSLYGIFDSSEVPKEPVVLREHPDHPDRKDYLAQRSLKLAVMEESLREEAQALNRGTREKTSKYLEAVREADLHPPASLDTFLGERGLVTLPFKKWQALIHAASEMHPVLGPWIFATTSAAANSENFETGLHSRLVTAATASEWNPEIVETLLRARPKTLTEVANEYAKIFVSVDNTWRELQTAAKKNKQAAPASLPDPAKESLRTWGEQSESPLALPLADIEKAFARKFLERKQKLMEAVNVLDGTHPGAPDRAIVLRDKPTPTEPVIFVRGNAGNRGARVPRRFLEILSPPDRPPYREGSGRLQLARDIASRDNPLTARVYVNRVWGTLFGKPLVSPAGDFGIRTPPPSIPELLDYLAFDFMEQGWSTKTLILRLVTSSAYRLSSLPDPAAEKRDPENRFIHHMNRKRLTFESLRDTLVLAGGSMDFTMGGRPVLLTQAPYPLRRTVYGFVDRQDLPSVFRSFDFASPDTSTAERFQTTVPQQALYLMNHPFVIDCAKALAGRLPDSPAEQRLRTLYQLVFQRNPSTEETVSLLQYLGMPPHGAATTHETPLSRWESLAQGLLLANESLFVD